MPDALPAPHLMTVPLAWIPSTGRAGSLDMAFQFPWVMYLTDYNALGLSCRANREKTGLGRHAIALDRFDLPR
jgi:hypothetical protein